MLIIWQDTSQQLLFRVISRGYVVLQACHSYFKPPCQWGTISMTEFKHSLSPMLHHSFSGHLYDIISNARVQIPPLITVIAVWEIKERWAWCNLMWLWTHLLLQIGWIIMNTLETLVNALVMHWADSDLHKKCCPSGKRFDNFLQQCTETATKKHTYRM